MNETGIGMIEWQPVFLSIKVAFASLSIVLILGVACAYGMRRWQFPGKAALEAIFSLPLVLPPVVTGFILLVLIGKQFLYVERYMKLLAPNWQMMNDPQLTGYFANFMVDISREHKDIDEVET